MKEPHQYCNKARRQWKAISVSQFRQNNRAKCFLEMANPALGTVHHTMLESQEKDTLISTFQMVTEDAFSAAKLKICLWPETGASRVDPEDAQSL